MEQIKKNKNNATTVLNIDNTSEFGWSNTTQKFYDNQTTKTENQYFAGFHPLNEDE